MNTYRKWLFSTVCFALTAVKAASAHAAEVKVAVSKDASLIRSSLCCANPSDSNFGSAATVDAGQYHHTSRALFAFTLPLFDSNTVIKKAELVLPVPQVVGSSPAALSLGYTTATWDEKTVTWNSRPSLAVIAGYNISANVTNKLDITKSVVDTAKTSQRGISFGLDATGSSNVFFKSKEGDPNNSAYLLITTESQPLPYVQLVTLKNRYSGRCLDVAGISPAAGANIHQWDCNAQDNQSFYLAEIPGTKTYALIAKHSSRCVDVASASKADGANVLQWNCTGGSNQTVRLLPVDTGASAYKVQFVHSNKCMDIDGPSVNNGANVHQWTCYQGLASQEWIVK